MAQPKWVWIAGGLAVLFVIGVVNDDGGGQGDAPATTTTAAVGEPTAAPPPEEGRQDEGRQDAAPETCTVPDVVGMVHQRAQDTMQDAGLFQLREEDATGRGRMLIVDRNWTTTAQSVAAGQVVACDTEITLAARKTDE
ncbi:hypothetical protein [Saccharothrix longispora]|uniref:hypothetical protein n=1 Tax=Saccharothrix longispora TaxID=33920 RepID=UPI0028FD5F0D|nr:hypothetical protein [Saccharothrix longispora]MDU0291440.1 hypothetical protein [Saccharothrix longispora]